MPIPSPSVLFKQTWDRFVKYPKEILQLSIWQVIVGAIAGLFVAFEITLVLGSIFSGSGQGHLFVPLLMGNLVLAVLFLWANTRLQRGLLFLSADHPVPEHDAQEALHLLPGSLWVHILFVLSSLSVLCGSLIGWSITNFLASLSVGFSPVASGGTMRILNILFGFGGILGIFLLFYTGPRLQFSVLAFLDQQKRGVAAIKDSWNLTRGRWASIVWRNIVVGLGLYIAAYFWSGIVGLVARIPHLALFSELLSVAFTYLVLVPFALLYNTQLYHALRNETP
jgi:hypothetical protein